MLALKQLSFEYFNCVKRLLVTINTGIKYIIQQMSIIIFIYYWKRLRLFLSNKITLISNYVTLVTSCSFSSQIELSGTINWCNINMHIQLYMYTDQCAYLTVTCICGAICLNKSRLQQVKKLTVQILFNLFFLRGKKPQFCAHVDTMYLIDEVVSDHWENLQLYSKDNCFNY